MVVMNGGTVEGSPRRSAYLAPDSASAQGDVRCGVGALYVATMCPAARTDGWIKLGINMRIRGKIWWIGAAAVCFVI